MKTTNRDILDVFDQIEDKNTDTRAIERKYDVIVGTVAVENVTLTVEMLRSQEYSHTLFLPAKITRHENGEQAVVWNYKEDAESRGFGRAHLFVLPGKTGIISLLSKDRKLAGVIPLADLAKGFIAERPNGGNIVIGPHSVAELLEIKKRIARQEGLETEFNPEEKQHMTALDFMEQEAAAAREIDKARQREELRALVMTRSLITVLTKNNARLTGYPVTADAEWRCLPDKTPIVLSGTDGKMEFFRTRVKGNGKTVRSDSKKVFPEKKTSRVKVLETLSFNLDNGGLCTIPVITNESLELMKASGANSGYRAAIMTEGDEEKYDVHVFKGNEPEILRALSPYAMKAT